MSDGRVDVASIRDYLTVHGWTIFRDDARRSIWQDPNTSNRVFVPNSEEIDFQDLSEIAINEIAQTERRDPHEVSLDISWAGWDKLTARRDSPTTSLPISDAVDMHLALSDLILSSARAASDKRRVFTGGRRPAVVDAYMDRVRILPSLPGSFVTRALLPLDAGEPQSLPLIGPADTRIRGVATTILEASSAAVTSARDFSSGNGIDVWDRGVPDGVSANLCDALARLCGYGEDEDPTDVDLYMDWTWSTPNTPVLQGVEIPAGLAPTLAYGGLYLRDQPEEFMVYMTGLIIKLHRTNPIGPGQVTARGFLEGFGSSQRSLTVDLDEATYHQAVSAHDRGRTVQIAALAKHAARGLQVIRAEDFRIIDS